MRRTERGFTLIELLLTLAIIGIISAIAIPKFLGARNTAKYIGDAKANGLIIMSNAETVRSDTTLYPAPGTYTWNKGVAAGTNPFPTMVLNNSKVNFQLTINADQLSFTLSAIDPDDGHTIRKVDQNGTILP